MLYPIWYYDVQVLLMVIAGLIFLILPVHSAALTIGIIALYLFLLGVISAISVVSDQSEMGWKFLICILGIMVSSVSLYYFFNNIFSFTQVFFLIFLTVISLFIGIVQVTRGFLHDDPVIRLIGVSTGAIGLVLIPSLYISEWWAPVVLGIILIIGGLVCYLLKKAWIEVREPVRYQYQDPDSNR